MRRRNLLRAGVALSAFGAGTAEAQPFVLNPPVAINPQILDFLRRFCFRPTLTRRNIYSLLAQSPTHPMVQAYRQAVSTMKGRPASDPTSWTYQANIHATALPQAQWPAGAPFDTCEHGTLFFLSWHRMYLHFFERIARAASGNPDFALPYWDYSLSGQAALPPPFRNASEGGSPNALHDNTRQAAVNSGGALPASAVTAAAALARTAYSGASGFQDALEGTPHGTVHVSIGGNMGFFEGAGRDPIFWLHHCNIDRLWEKWLSQGGGRSNPTSNSTWMSRQYTFADENRNLVTMTGADILFTVSQLGYQYEDPQICIPLVIRPPRLIARPEEMDDGGLATAVAERAVTSTTIPIARDVRISPDQARVELRASTPQARERMAASLAPESLAEAVEGGRRVILSFEGFRTDQPLNGYFEVYIGLPEGAEPSPSSPHYAGNLVPFGADSHSRRAMKSAHEGHGGGLTVRLDVTETVNQAVDRSAAASLENLAVTLVPAGVAGAAAERFTFSAEANPQIDAVVLTLAPTQQQQQQQQ